MNKRLNIIFCGTTNDVTDKSWGKTNNFFLDQLKKDANVIAVIDYGIKSKFLKTVNKFLSQVLYGGSVIRNPFLDSLMERKFLKKMKEVQAKPDMIIHSNSICVPEGLLNFKHVQYTDSSLVGFNKYNQHKVSEKYLEVFNSESKKYFSRLSKMFTFNNWTKDSLIVDYNVSESKVDSIGFGANLNPYNGEKNYENHLILTVLRRGKEKEKGFDLLLDGFELAKKRNSKLNLAVVGTTGKATDGVVYYENFPREKTIELFHEASLFAMPALSEPNGMVYIEALACKTPILGLNRLAFPEFCGHGKYGFIAEQNPESICNSILKAFEDKIKLKEMGIEGQKFVLSKYDWEIVVKKILSTYEHI